jgi:poly(A) polymerase
MSFLGVTPPISSASPTPKELQCNTELETFLTLHRIAESDEGNRKRKVTVEFLQDVFKQWVTEVGLKRGVAEAECAGGAGARLFVFGSQRLGVHAPDADIDILCCAPQFTSRYDFFLTFLDNLKAMDAITNVLSLPEAYTPVIKFSLNNFSIDLVFVSLAMPKIPEDIDILDNSNLQKLDEASIRSLNGVRVTERILQLVPDQKTFSVALRAIKCWATRRGIYANVLGFLGGVNYAILVAFVCQRFTHACPSTIIHQFFKIFAQWHWPAPIILANVSDIENVDQADMIRVPSWNPKLYPSDGYHLMPIITPAFPSMNSAFNVSIPQFRMIQLQIQRGLYLFENMENAPSANTTETVNMTTSDDGELKEQQENGTKPTSIRNGSIPFLPHQSILWNTLFASVATDFFQLFPRYIQIDVIAQTAEEHRLWFGWCESRLRQLFVSIEQSQMVFCHPNANCFHRRISASQSCEEVEDGFVFSSSFFIGLSFPERTRSLDLTEIIQTFKYRVCAWVGKTPTMDLKLKPLQKGYLPDFVYSDVSLPSNATDCTPVKPARPEQSMGSPPGFTQIQCLPPTTPGDMFAVSTQPDGYDEEQVDAKAPELLAPGGVSGHRARGVSQSGSTPQLAQLALDNPSNEEKKQEENVPPPPSVPDPKVANQGRKLLSKKKTTTRIEKQLFSDNNNRSSSNISSSHDNKFPSQVKSSLHLEAEGQSEQKKTTSSKASTHTAPPCSPPPPPPAPVYFSPGLNRSPLKTSRKEYSDLTGERGELERQGQGQTEGVDVMCSSPAAAVAMVLEDQTQTVTQTQGQAETLQQQQQQQQEGPHIDHAGLPCDGTPTAPALSSSGGVVEETLPCFSSPLKRVRPNY